MGWSIGRKGLAAPGWQESITHLKFYHEEGKLTLYITLLVIFKTTLYFWQQMEVSVQTPNPQVPACMGDIMCFFKKGETYNFFKKTSPGHLHILWCPVPFSAWIMQSLLPQVGVLAQNIYSSSSMDGTTEFGMYTLIYTITVCDLYFFRITKPWRSGYSPCHTSGTIVEWT